MYIRRLLEPLIQERAKSYSVVSVVGPRQSGKTTLARHAFPDHTYVNLERTLMKLYAKNDPEGFLQEYAGGKGVIIDEFQNVPELLSDIMVTVDEEKKPGQFILTGSQNYLLNRRFKQSLAGRVSLNTLLPLSQLELQEDGQSPSDLDMVLYSGMYPSVYTDQKDLDHWYDNYVRTLLEQDIPYFQKIDDTDQFKLFLRLCAGRIGQIINYSSLGRDCGISDQTARRWLALLKKTFVAYPLKSYSKKQQKTLVKRPKLYFYDTGLACNLLSISQKQVSTHYLKGELFESYVLSEIMKSFYNSGTKPDLYYWRNKTGDEIDVLVKYKHLFFPIEVKSNKTLSLSFFKGLTHWNEITKSSADQGFVVYGGKENQNWKKGRVLGWQSVSEIKNTADRLL